MTDDPKLRPPTRAGRTWGPRRPVRGHLLGGVVGAAAVGGALAVVAAAWPPVAPWLVLAGALGGALTVARAGRGDPWGAADDRAPRAGSPAAAREQRVRAVLDASDDLLVAIDGDGRLAFVDDSVTRVLGVAPETLTGLAVAAVLHPDDVELFAARLTPEAVASGGPGGPVRLRVAAIDGSWRAFDWTVAGSADENGAIVLAGRDVSGEVALKAQLAHQATHDPLTGLPNRTGLLEALEDLLEGPETGSVAVLIIDVDRFKDVNDSLGHAMGDLLLGRIGWRMRSVLRPSDLIARIGADEFAVLLPTADVDAAQLVAQRLSATLDEVFVVGGTALRIEASIGIALSLGGGARSLTGAAGLLRQADIAMHRAKANGAGLAVFEPGRDTEQTRARLELAADLRRGIESGQLVLHYQPVVDVVRGDLAGVEALVRWEHPVRGLLPPGEFLPLAEQSALVVGLSRVVLDQALAQVARWRTTGRLIQVAVNVSPRWLHLDDVPAVVASALAAHGVPAELLRLEITETAALVDSADALAMVSRLRETGVTFSLDDFGTGFSSMTHLRSLPVDELKVDRAFVQAMVDIPEDGVIVRSAIELGHNLGMTVVAEGVENSDVLAEIIASGCSLVQGYYFARPLPAADLVAWVDEHFPLSRSATREGVLPDELSRGRGSR